jgi:formamidopyrimidine-DNA glycosylase
LKKAIEKEADVSKLPKSYLLPNREEGNDCPKCNGKIEKIKVSGRTGYYCPSCQKK